MTRAPNHKVRPITPAEAEKGKNAAIPDFVVECVNALLSTGKRNFSQNTVIDSVLKRAPAGTTRADVYSNGWLDFEPLFRAAGWTVVYDKPGYCESYEANFTFSRKKDPT